MVEDFEIRNQPHGTCRRCGTCCRFGGPALHRRDRSLVADGHIDADRLFTIRPGELARDNVRDDRLTSCGQDIIKIRSRPGADACIYFDPAGNACTIYAHRPLECRVLDCRDSAAIEALYDRERLCRQDLIGAVDGLWDLVSDHERRCSAGQVVALAGAWRCDGRKRHSLEQELMEKVRYDLELRRLLVKDGRMAGGILDLVFGRPLTVILKSSGVEVRRMKGSLALFAAPWPSAAPK